MVNTHPGLPTGHTFNSIKETDIYMTAKLAHSNIPDTSAYYSCCLKTVKHTANGDRVLVIRTSGLQANITKKHPYIRAHFCSCNMGSISQPCRLFERSQGSGMSNKQHYVERPALLTRGKPDEHQKMVSAEALPPSQSASMGFYTGVVYFFSLLT